MLCLEMRSDGRTVCSFSLVTCVRSAGVCRESSLLVSGHWKGVRSNGSRSRYLTKYLCRIRTLAVAMTTEALSNTVEVQEEGVGCFCCGLRWSCNLRRSWCLIMKLVGNSTSVRQSLKGPRAVSWLLSISACCATFCASRNADPFTQSQEPGDDTIWDGKIAPCCSTPTTTGRGFDLALMESLERKRSQHFHFQVAGSALPYSYCRSMLCYR